jgi:hypothetical protein
MSRPIILVVLSVAVMGAAFAGWQAWRYWRLFQFYQAVSRSEDLDELQPSVQHLQAIRKLHFVWDNSVESGGPIVDYLAPYGHAAMEDDLGPIIGTRDKMAVAAFNVEVSRALSWALENGELPEGRYAMAHLDNAIIERTYLDGVAENEKLTATQKEQFRSEVPHLDPDRSFYFTKDHLLLLRHLRFGLRPPKGSWSFHSNPVPTVNFKRPFGDMSAFDIDMAEILGLPRPEGQDFDPALWKLYVEMLPALQVFVEHAQIPVRPE